MPRKRDKPELAGIRAELDGETVAVRNGIVKQFQTLKKQKRASLKDCALLAGLSERQLSTLLSDGLEQNGRPKSWNPNLRTLVALARGVGCSLEQLLATPK